MERVIGIKFGQRYVPNPAVTEYAYVVCFSGSKP